MNLRYKLLALPLLSALLLISAGCTKDPAPANPSGDVEGIRLTIGTTEADQTIKTRLRASVEENKVNDVMVFLFNTTDGSIFDKPYHFRAVDNADRNLWENANTVIIPKHPSDVGKKIVVVVANYMGKGDIQTRLATVTKASDLSAILYESAAENKKISTDGGILMQGHTVHEFTDLTRKATVDIRRAVAKLTVTLFLDWAGLDASKPQNFYQFRDLGKTTSIIERSVLILTPANRAERYNDNNTTDHLWPFLAASSRVGPLTTEIYLNEYNQFSDMSNVPPYLYLKLKGNIPASGDPGTGLYPPPAGGDYVPAHEADLYYRLILPRQIRRNTYYKIEAHILQAGSEDARKPTDVKLAFDVADWSDPIDLGMTRPDGATY